MNNPLAAIEKLRRLQSVNPDGQYCITMNASGHYRVVDVEDKVTKPIDIDTLLPHIENQALAEFFENYL